MSFDIITSPPTRANLANTNPTPPNEGAMALEFGKIFDGMQQLDEALQVARLASISGARGLNISTTGTNASVTVTADEAIVLGAKNLVAHRGVSLTINTAASGANGLDTGTLASSTWYSVWLISTGTAVAGLISTSATAPTLPGGYSLKLRIGWIRTDASLSKFPLSMRQNGRSVQYKTASGSNVPNLPLMASGTAGSVVTPNWAAIALGGFVPPTAGTVHVVLSLAGGSAAGNVILAPNDQFGAYNSASNPPPIQSGLAAGHNIAQTAAFDIEGANIYWASNYTGTVLVMCRGWTDNL